MIRTLLEIYFAINILTVGYYWGREREINIGILSLILIALPFHLLYLIEILFKKIDRYEYVRFFFYFLFSKQYHNLTNYQLERMNKVAQNKSKIYKYCMKLINKRNKYEPPF